MSERFKKLPKSASQSEVKTALTALAPLMSRRLARLFGERIRRRAERDVFLFEKFKSDKEDFLIRYNLIVELRQQRVGKVLGAAKIIADWYNKISGVAPIQIPILNDILKQIEETEEEN